MYNLYLQDRFETQSLVSNGVNVTDYPMRSARPQTRGRRASSLSAAMPDLDDVSETIRLLVTGASQAALQDTVRVLERLMDRARMNSRRRREDAVYLYIQLDGDSSLWRTEVLEGEVVVENPLDDLWKLKAPVSISLTRRYFWEYGAANPVELQLTSSSQGTPGTGGRAITTTNDANWVQIAAGQVTGALPAPVMLDIESTGASPQFVSTLWAINNAHANPATVDMYRMAAEMTGGGSNRWLLPASLVNGCAGKFARVVVCHTGTILPGTLQGSIEVDIGSAAYRTAWWGPQVPTAGVADLGVFPIPPGGATTGYEQVYFRLFTNATVHHVQFIPVSSERRYTLVRSPSEDSVGLESGEAMVDDQITGEAYMQIAAGGKRAWVLGYGGPLYVYPNTGMAQRIVFPWAGVGTAFNAGYTAKVSAWYRPRRGTV